MYLLNIYPHFMGNWYDFFLGQGEYRKIINQTVRRYLVPFRTSKPAASLRDKWGGTGNGEQGMGTGAPSVNGIPPPGVSHHRRQTQSESTEAISVLFRIYTVDREWEILS